MIKNYKFRNYDIINYEIMKLHNKKV